MFYFAHNSLHYKCIAFPGAASSISRSLIVHRVLGLHRHIHFSKGFKLCAVHFISTPLETDCEQLKQFPCWSLWQSAALQRTTSTELFHFPDSTSPKFSCLMMFLHFLCICVVYDSEASCQDWVMLPKPRSLKSAVLEVIETGWLRNRCYFGAGEVSMHLKHADVIILIFFIRSNIVIILPWDDAHFLFRMTLII